MQVSTLPLTMVNQHMFHLFKIDNDWKYKEMIKKYEQCRDYRSDEACIIFHSKISTKFKYLKRKLLEKITTNYKSTFDKICSFRIIEATRFLKSFSKEFTYEGFSYDELPMFYEVVQSKHDQYGAMRVTHDVQIYGYYIDNPEIVTLKTRVREYCHKYINRINNEVAELYNISVLPSSLLRQITRIAKGKIQDLSIIKLYTVRTIELGKVMRLYRGTQYEEDYSDILDEIDRLVRISNLVEIPMLYYAKLKEK